MAWSEVARGRAVGVVVKDGNLLVMKRDNHGRHYFTLPGGGVESGETKEQAVRRELMEEASLEVKVQKLIYEHHYDNGSSQYYYLCSYLSGEPRLQVGVIEVVANSEGDLHEPIWLPTQRLAETLLYPLEIRDWLISDLKNGFPEKPRVANLKIQDLRQTLDNEAS